ncbi:MAG: hypothetical protein Q8O56_06170 [Solirubrobacteraceae bacterium]|nr:hypothetical protein [Solirubrobacteraceae bacterium]
MSVAAGKVGTGYVDIVGDFAPLHRQLERMRSQHHTAFRRIGDDAARGIQPGLDRVRRAAQGTSDDVHGTRRAFALLGRQGRETEMALRSMNRVFTAVRPAMLVTGLGLAAQGLSALVVGGIAVTSALAPIVGVSAAVGQGFTAMAQTVGLLRLAFSGVGGAIKEQVEAQASAGASALSSANAQRTAARAIEAATEGVREAHEGARRAALRVSDSERDLRDRLVAVATAQTRARDTQAALTQARVDARRGLEDLRSALVDATTSQTRATWALVDARRGLQDLLDGPDPQNLAEAHDAVSDSAREEERAQLDLLAQRRDTAAVLGDASATAEEHRRAVLALADAENRVADVARQRARAHAALAKLQAPVAEMDLARSRQQVADAEHGVTLAITQRTRAAEDLADAERRGVNGSREVIAASRDIIAAARDERLARRGVADATRDVSEARRAQALAERDIGRALQGVRDAQLSAAASTAKLSEEFDGLTPSAQAFVATLVGFKPRLDELRAAAAAGFFPGATEGLNDAMGAFSAVNRVTGVTANVLGDLARRAGELVGSRGFGRDLTAIGLNNARVIDSLGTASISLASAFRHVLVAAAPLTTWLADSTARWAANKDAQAAAGREAGRLGAYFDRTRGALQSVTNIVTEMWAALRNIGRAARPLGDEILAALEKSARGFREWTESTAGAAQLRKYFDDAKPAIFEIGRLIRDVTNTFFRLGASKGLAPLIQQLRTSMLPTLERIIEITTVAFGPALVQAATQVLELLGELASGGGPFVIYVDLLTLAAQGLTLLLKHVPGLKELVVATLALAAATRTILIARALFGFTLLTGAAKAAASAYRALTAGQTASTVAAQQGTAAMIAAKVALLAKTAALWAAATAQRAVAAVSLAAMYAQLVVQLVAVRIAALAMAAAQRAMAAAQVVLNAAMAANPIGLVVVALAALTAGMVWAYRNIEWFRDVVDGAFRVIKEAAGWAVSAIVGQLDWMIATFTWTRTAASDTGRWIGRAWDDAKDWVEDATASIGNTVKGTWRDIRAQTSSTWGDLKDIVRSGLAEALRVAKGFGESWIQIGQDIVTGIVNGIWSGIQFVWDAIRNIATGAIDRLRGLLGIRSPSRAFMRLGEQVGAGFAAGITARAGLVAAAVAGLVAIPTTSEVALASPSAPMISSIATMHAPASPPQLTSRDDLLGAIAVRVFIGDRELHDIVRVELDEDGRRRDAQWDAGVIA